MLLLNCSCFYYECHLLLYNIILNNIILYNYLRLLFFFFCSVASLSSILEDTTYYDIIPVEPSRFGCSVRCLLTGNMLAAGACCFVCYQTCISPSDMFVWLLLAMMRMTWLTADLISVSRSVNQFDPNVSATIRLYTIAVIFGADIQMMNPNDHEDQICC